MNIECPQCGSKDFTKLSVVYAEGFSDLEARSRGTSWIFGADGPDIAFGKITTEGTLQTRLSHKSAPPRKKRYRAVVLAWFLGLLIGGWLFGYLDFIFHRSDFAFTAQFTWFVYLFSGVAAFVIVVLWRFNHSIYPQRRRVWERSFMCRRCGRTAVRQLGRATYSYQSKLS